MTPQRKKAEKLVFDVMSAMDPSGKVADYYKKIFSDMSDKEFTKFVSGKYPFRFITRVFEIEPTMDQVEKAANVMGVPILEKVSMSYIYEDENGKGVTSHEALVGYLHLKRMKQFLTKKNAISTNISMRDNKTGMLISHDKNGITSDREMESLVVSGMDATIKELSRARADSMEAKQAMYNTISTMGYISQDDIPDDPSDPMSKNLLNVYMLGAHLSTNLINIGNVTPLTLSGKKISRRE